MASNRSKRNHRNKRKRRSGQIGLLIFYILIALLLLLGLIALTMQMLKTPIPIPDDTTPETIVIDTPVSETQAQTTAETESETPAGSETIVSVDPQNLQEEDIYTFLQGPKSWSMKVDWSGSWCNIVLADQEFSVFGCGLCALASIYGTLTPYDCSPIDMFYYAQEVSGYHPVSGFGAIDWRYMQQTLKSVGITSTLRHKDKTYEKFQNHIANATAAITLINSGNDDTYWQNTPGHYVVIWKYNAEDDTVFLSDSGNPDHNRQRIPLRYIYDALKTSSVFQYQVIKEYKEEKNTWKHDGIDLDWKKPAYYKG